MKLPSKTLPKSAGCLPALFCFCIAATNYAFTAFNVTDVYCIVFSIPYGLPTN